MIPKQPPLQLSITKQNEPHFAFESWLEDLENVPVNEQKQWILETLRPKHMLHIFGMYFFSHFVNSKTAACHLELIHELTSPGDSAIIFPRGFAKTTWEKIDTIHDMVYCLETVIVYVSSTFSAAQLHLEHIKTELESNDLLISVYGLHSHVYGKRSFRWNLKRLQTSKNVNLVARGRMKGRGVNINGERPSKIIIDDVEDDQQVSSSEQREKLHDWLYRVIYPSKDPKRGKIKMIGTVLSPLCEVLKFYQAHGGIFRKAIENDQSIWPDMFPLKKLQEIKTKIGTRSFSQEYLNTPMNAETSTIHPDWIEKTYWEKLDNIHEMNIVIMFDPQAGKSEKSDFYGLCVVGYFPNDRHRYILEIQTGRGSALEQAALFVSVYQRYYGAPNLTAGIEVLMNQVAAYDLILDWIARKIDLDIEQHFKVDNSNRNINFFSMRPDKEEGGVLVNKKVRMESHQAEFERGEIHLHSTMRTFGEKLTCFPNVDHDDDIDALIYCLEYANRDVDIATFDDDESSDNEDRLRDMGRPLGDVMSEQY